MLTQALLLMFAAASGQPALFSAGAPRAVQLVSRDAPPSNYKGWTVEQMRTEYERVRERRPGVVLPLTLLLTGITGMSVALFAYAIAAGNYRGPDTLANIVFGVGATTSAAAIVVGGIFLWGEAPERRVLGAQMETLERLADGQERDERLLELMELWEQRHGPGRPPPLIGPPPVGPPPPTSAPPVVPGPPIIPGQVSLVFPVFSARF